MLQETAQVDLRATEVGLLVWNRRSATRQIINKNIKYIFRCFFFETMYTIDLAKQLSCVILAICTYHNGYNHYVKLM